jgi:16S rRNA (guanine527-N7)-methyltransferase
MDKLTFKSKLAELGINLTEEQMNQFQTYYRVLVEWNEKMNLTAITAEEEVYLKHFYDSISAAFHVDYTKELSICDVGAGAGFPSIPLKICFPHLKVTIVDSLNKRITFLNELAKELNLSNVFFYHARAEEFAKNKDFRETFDLVMARAVARLSVLSELCLPLVKVGGVFVAMKGAQFLAEVEDAKRAIAVLGGEVEEVFTFELPIEHSERNIAVIKKLKQSPKKYPRKAGTPNKNPIT